MVIYTAALQDSQSNRLYTRLPGVNIYLLFTRQPFQSKFRLYTRLPCVHIKWLFTRQPFKSQIGYIHCCRVYTKSRYLHGSRSRAKSATCIYIAAGCIKNRYLHGSSSRAKSAIYIGVVCIHKTVIFMAAIQEQTRLYTLLPGVYT